MIASNFTLSLDDEFVDDWKAAIDELAAAARDAYAAAWQDDNPDQFQVATTMLFIRAGAVFNIEADWRKATRSHLAGRLARELPRELRLLRVAVIRLGKDLKVRGELADAGPLLRAASNYGESQAQPSTRKE